ncbi:MAG: hypothetical protein AAGM22_11775 [Acidobacteriota bacterium]
MHSKEDPEDPGLASGDSAPPGDAASQVRGVHFAFGVAATAVGLGYVCLSLARRGPHLEIGTGPREYYNIFWVLSERHEPLALSIVLVALAIGYWMNVLRRAELRERRAPRWLVPGLAGAAFLVTALGTSLVFLDFPLSMDEYNMEFQAEIFSRGQLSAEVPEPWRPYADALSPSFVDYNADTRRWASSYLPIYAALRAAVLTVHPKLPLNPLLAAVSVLLIAAVARRLWPDRRGAEWVAVALLVTSSHFLVTSMTFYPLTGHLAFNLLWLWLYLRDDRLGWALVPLVGALAMGLHQFVNHAIFAAPFLLRVVLDRRWSLAAWLAGTYTASLSVWFAWMQTQRADSIGDIASKAWGLPGHEQWLFQGLSWTQAFTWQMPFAVVLTVLGLLRFPNLPTPVKDAALSVLITGAFFLTFRYDQGHGWGYRYLFPALGCLVLLMTAGALELFDRLGAGRGRALLATGFATSLLVLLPIRLLQVHALVLPFAAASDYLAKAPTDAVFLDGNSVWYGRDLVRNDPFFERGPVIIDTSDTRGVELHAIQREHKVVLEAPSSLARWGLILTTPLPDDLSVKEPMPGDAPAHRPLDPEPPGDPGPPRPRTP